MEEERAESAAQAEQEQEQEETAETAGTAEAAETAGTAGTAKTLGMTRTAGTDPEEDSPNMIVYRKVRLRSFLIPALKLSGNVVNTPKTGLFTRSLIK